MFQPDMFESNHLLLDQMNQNQKTSEDQNDLQLDMLRDDEFDTKSGGTDGLENPSGDDQDPSQHPNKKKRYHRHTQHQIQEMEA